MYNASTLSRQGRYKFKLFRTLQCVLIVPLANKQLPTANANVEESQWTLCTKLGIFPPRCIQSK